MKANSILCTAIALLALTACQKENGVGNGPGDADGVGGRADPPAATSDQAAPSTENATSDWKDAPAPTEPTQNDPPQER
jgi:hypothetical protein